MAYLVACALAMYSASFIDKTIVDLYLLLQEMAPPPIMDTNPMVYLQYLRSLA
jgi:hypothetical protein